MNRFLACGIMRGGIVADCVLNLVEKLPVHNCGMVILNAILLDFTFVLLHLMR